MKIKVFGACHTHLGEALDFDGEIDNEMLQKIVDNDLTWEGLDLPPEDCDMLVEVTTTNGTLVFREDYEDIEHFKTFITGMQVSAQVFVANFKDA